MLSRQLSALHKTMKALRSETLRTVGGMADIFGSEISILSKFLSLNHVSDIAIFVLKRDVKLQLTN